MNKPTNEYSGMSMRELGVIFGIHHRDISSRISATRDIIAKSKLYTNNIGFSHITAQEIINAHTTPYARALFGGDTNPVVVLDGKALLNLLS